MSIKAVKTDKVIMNMIVWEVGECAALACIESDEKAHLSISHNKRLPSYEELKIARYEIFPEIKYMAQIFPPKEEFVNLHENCLHLFEIEK